MSSIITDSARVYKLVSLIPAGKVLTYGQIARFLEISTPRLVGKILHKNPSSADCPCHRVVFSDGSLAPEYAFGGEEVQRQKLNSEKVPFKGNKVDIKNASFDLTARMHLLLD